MTRLRKEGKKQNKEIIEVAVGRLAEIFVSQIEEKKKSKKKR